MRSILAALAFAAIPGAAFADCGCVCSLGRSVGVCTFSYEQPPICARICPQAITQQLPSGALIANVSPPSLTSVAPTGGTLPNDPNLAAALLNAGTGNTNQGGTGGASSGALSGALR